MSDPFIIQDQDRSIKDSLLTDYTGGKYEGDFWFGSDNIKLEPLKNFLTKRKSSIIFAFVILGLFVLFSRVFYLQVYKGDYYQGIAERNRIRLIPIRANRGVIYDTNQDLLVRNIPNFSLFFVPADMPKDIIERDLIIRQLSGILSKTKEEIKNILEKTSAYSYEPVLLEEGIDYDKAVLLKIKSVDWPGILIETQAKREYLFNSFGLAHLLGYTGKLTPEEFSQRRDKDYLIDDYIGRTGLESSYENDLKGRNGKKKVEVDFLGKEEKVISVDAPIPGQDLILSLNLEFQQTISELLAKEVKKVQATKAVAIVMKVGSGEILGLVSLPDYDNNLFSQGLTAKEYRQLINDKDQPLFFRAISGEYPSGSIIKPILAAGALEDEIITPRKTFLSTGGIRINKWFFPDWKPGGHGRIDVVKAIAQSVNTFFYHIGGGYEEFEGLGLERMNQWFEIFGLNKKTGVDLPGESAGFLPTRKWKLESKGEPWYIGDTYHLAIGQGDILITPIQAVNFTAAIANGGTLYKPCLVKQIENSGSGAKKNIEPEIIRSNFVKPEILEIIKQGMREAVIYGSAVALNNLPIKVAGKTGTAQVSGDQEPHAWFVGFAPYEAPEIALVVMIENGGEGSRAAVPVAREIFQWYFREN